MLYLVTGDLLNDALLNSPHEEFVQLIHRVFAPSLELINQQLQAGTILGGGVTAGTQRVHLILDLKADSHFAVRQFLQTLPIFGYYRWDVTPLESFQEWLSTLRK